jgi:hypothetical protein
VQGSDAVKAYLVLCNNVIAMTDKGTVVPQVSLDSQKDVPGLRSEACASSSLDGVQAVNIKVEEFSDIEDREDPVPKTILGIKTEHEVSCMTMSVVRHISVTSRIVCSLSHLHLSHETSLV